MKYTVVLEPQDEGGFTVQCVEIPGAISEGGRHWKKRLPISRKQ
jgi:hypothetical protein